MCDPGGKLMEVIVSLILIVLISIAGALWTRPEKKLDGTPWRKTRGKVSR
jgi:hypothetical protein